MVVRSRVAGLLLLAAAIAAMSCGSKDNEVNIDQSNPGAVKNVGQSCDASKDDGFCGGGTCVAGLCRVGCESDGTCEAGSLCITEPSTKLGGCRLPSEAECSATQPCPSALLKCGLDGTCRSPCTASVPCPRQDQTCIQGSCFGKTENLKDCTADHFGDFQCVGAELQVCGVGWIAVETCATAGLCQSSLDSGKCAEPVCSPGEAWCEGATLKVCNGERTQFDEASCANAALCQLGKNAGTCKAPACSEGEKKCEGNLLMVCNEDRTGFEFEMMCQSAELCSLGVAEAAKTCKPASCSPGDWHCQGKVLQRCDPSRTGFENVATCETDKLCELGLSLGACKEPACDVGQLLCNGQFLSSCNEDRTGFKLEATCDSATLCAETIADADGGIPGQCEPAVCQPGEYRCTGADLEACKYDQSQFVKLAACASSALCETGKLIGACPLPACGPGESRCKGKTLETCKPDRTGFAAADICYSEALCLEGMSLPQPACKQPACTQGKCSGLTMTGCKADGTTWVQSEQCQTLELCELGIAKQYVNPNTLEVEKVGICEPPACRQNELFAKMDGGVWVIDMCNPAQTAQVTSTCTGGQYPVCTSTASLDRCSATIPSFSCCLNLLGNQNPGTATAVCAPAPADPVQVQITAAGGSFRVDAYPVMSTQFEAFVMAHLSSFKMGEKPSMISESAPLDCNGNWPFTDEVFKFGQPGWIYDQASWCEASVYCQSKGKRLCGRIGGGELSDAELSGTETQLAAIDEWFHVCSSNGQYTYPYGDIFSSTACAQPSIPDTTCTSNLEPFNAVHLMTQIPEWISAPMNYVHAGVYADAALNFCRLSSHGFGKPAAIRCCDD